ncbi:MAG: addiction module protein [Planctomycetota bacterium]
MTSDVENKSNAIFTSDHFDREWHPEGGDSHPPPGREFAVALGIAFADAGWQVMQLPDTPPPDERDDNWEHSYWFLHITRDSQSYWVYLEPIGDDDTWRVGSRNNGGCLTAAFSIGQKRGITNSLRLDAESIIKRLAGCTDLWATNLARMCYNRTMTNIHEILTAAQALPASERAQLIATLWDSVLPVDWVPPDSQWIAEVNRRSQAYDSGEMSGSIWAEVRERARREAGLDG